MQLQLILRAAQAALISLLQPRAWLLILAPPFLALLVWAGILSLTWTHLAGLIDAWFVSPQIIDKYFSFMREPLYLLLPIFRTIWVFSLCFLLLGIIFASALLITSGLVIPILLKSIQAKSYPHLRKVGRTHFLKSFWHSLVVTIEVALLFVLSLPLWIIPGASILFSGFLTGYLGSKIFPFEILSEYATPEEMNKIMRQHRITFILVGMLAFVANLFPLAFLISPVFTALIFIHICLDLLNKQRLTQ